MTLIAADEADLAALGLFRGRLEEGPRDPRLTWRQIARPDQLLPPITDPWRVLLLTGGRGSGKSRSGSQGLAEIILGDPEPEGQYGICAPTYRDAWTVDVEGDSGILRALGTTAGEVKHGRSRLVSYAHRSYGEIGLRSGHTIYVDSADDGALRIQGKNLRAIWCIDASTSIECRDAIKYIRNVRPGDEVRTRYGWRRVLAARCTGRSVPVVEINTASGVRLRCTPDHRIWVHGRGWVQACQLNPGDRLYLARLPGSSSTAGATTGSRPATTPPVTDASRPASTSPSGKRPAVASSAPATWSTTSTTTRRTTSQVTSPTSPTPTTTGTTAAASRGLPSQWNGYGRGSGNHGTSAVTAPSPASSVKGSSRRDLPGGKSAAAPSSAPPSCVGMSAERPRSCPARDHATSAEASSPRRTADPTSAPVTAPTLTCVTSVRPSGQADVYDLTVEDAHEFFAGGILVHNCDELGLWARWQVAWDESIRYAVRKGASKIIATGTPKVSRPARALLRRLLRGEEPGVIVRRLRTIDNAPNLSEAFYQSVIGAAKGTRLERQELEGELLDDVENALWNRALLEAIQVPAVGADGGIPYLHSAVIGVDPSDGKEDSDEQAYTVAGKGSPTDPHLYVAENWGGQMAPAAFARKVILKAVEWNARIVVEKNHGGEWLVTTFHQVAKDLDKAGQIPDHQLPRVETIHASQAKRTRAEPVSALYERGVVRHCYQVEKYQSADRETGQLSWHADRRGMVDLEDQMATFTGAAGERSPDRLDSCLAAGTPVLTARGEVPIEDVVPGEVVWTRQGWKPVEGVVCTQRAAEVMTVELSDGRTLAGTPDHRVWVEGRGWARMDSLVWGDILSGWQNPRQNHPLRSPIGASPTNATLMRNNERTASITAHRAAADTTACTVTSGVTTTPARTSLRAGTSITTTTTRSTTPPETWSSGPRKGMPPSTLRSTECLPSTWQRSGPWLPSGTAATRAAPGTSRTGSTYGTTGNPSTGAPARNAAASSRPGSTAPGTARVPASTGLPNAGYGRPAPASSAKPNTRLAARPEVRPVPLYVVGRCADGGRRPVYDLTVTDAHEFTAAGLIVHNCVWALTPFLNASFLPPGKPGKRDWAGAEEMRVSTLPEEARADRRMREIRERAMNSTSPAPWDDLDAFSPQDEDTMAARSPRGNVRQWQ